MMEEQVLMSLKKDVRSILISSKVGRNPEQLKRDYLVMVGHPLPLQKLGYRNVVDMVLDMPDVVSYDFGSNGPLLRAVADESTKAIEQLVAKQRSPKAKNSFRNAYSCPPHSPLPPPRRGPAPKVVPLQLRGQLWQLLSNGPIALSELEACYSRSFGRPLQIAKYGFYSFTEMLAAASDFITVQQTRWGSQLELKDARDVKGTQGQGAASKCDVEASRKHASCSTLDSAPPWEGKLEETLKNCILEGGPVDTVNAELKEKLCQIVGQDKEGISLQELSGEYKRRFGEDLPLAQCGFPSVTEMVSAFSDAFYMTPGAKQEEQQWMVIDVRNKERGQSGTSRTAESVNASNRTSGDLPEGSHWESEVVTPAIQGQTELKVANKTFHMWEETGTPGRNQRESMQKEVGNSTKDVGLLPVTAPCVMDSSAVPLDAVYGKRLLAAAHRQERELVAVVVEMAESPSHFYVRFDNTNQSRALENMMFEMRTCYTGKEVAERYQLPDGYVKPGQLCCIAPRNIWFYRVIIHRVLSDSQVEVYYVDFGDLMIVDRRSLKFLKSCYAELPAQAVPSALAGVRPTTGSWSQAAIHLFQKLCFERTLVAAIHGYQNDVLQVYLCDTHTDNDVYIHTTLLAEGHALQSFHEHSEQNCWQFNPVALYLCEGLPEDKVEDFINKWSQKFSNWPESCNHLEARHKKCTCVQEEDDLTDLPELEFITSNDISGLPQVVNNPFEVLLCKDQSADWDQGWVQGQSSDNATLDSELQLASMVQHQEDKGSCWEKPFSMLGREAESVIATPKPKLTCMTSVLAPHQKTLIENCTTGLPQQSSPLFAFPMFRGEDKQSMEQCLRRYTSPSVLGPAAWLAAGSHYFSWCLPKKT